eukprot:TRINITY_DN7391_c2_g1_i1.p1 TRINITY_DN7391_c2_g1~~TRINITY_DN7391_c2_g1_i1.p1  ORF type:complete len:898 (+),score=262.27 TRINITY_DN7391_c2_g1_i1:85-2694(+)
MPAPAAPRTAGGRATVFGGGAREAAASPLLAAAAAVQAAGAMGVPAGSVEQFLLAELASRDAEIAALRGQLLGLQCAALRGEGPGPSPTPPPSELLAPPSSPPAPQALRAPAGTPQAAQRLLRAGSGGGGRGADAPRGSAPSGSAQRRAAPARSTPELESPVTAPASGGHSIESGAAPAAQDSLCSSRHSDQGSQCVPSSLPPTPRRSHGSHSGDDGDAFRIRVQSPSPPPERDRVRTPGERAGSPGELPGVAPLLQALRHDPIFEEVATALGDLRALSRCCGELGDRLARYCTVSLQVAKARYTLEPGVASEAGAEALDAALARRRRAVFGARWRRTHRRFAAVDMHSFMASSLAPRFNTVIINVNHPKVCFRRGPPGLQPEVNPAVRDRGLNVGVLSTLHSSIDRRWEDYVDAFRWLKGRNVRLFYPRASVPHMVGILGAVSQLNIRPSALVIDVCLVKPKWFPGIEFIKQYPNIFLLPEIPPKESLDEGEGARIRQKFNRYLSSFAAAGASVYVVLPTSIAHEVGAEEQTARVNVLSLPLPERDGPVGLREYPLLELLTALDSVLDDSFTLHVPAEREAPGGPAATFSPAAGGGGSYRYAPSQVFRFHRAQRRFGDDDDGHSDSCSVLSVSSHGSRGSSRSGFRAGDCGRRSGSLFLGGGAVPCAAAAEHAGAGGHPAPAAGEGRQRLLALLDEVERLFSQERGGQLPAPCRRAAMASPPPSRTLPAAAGIDSRSPSPPRRAAGGSRGRSATAGAILASGFAPPAAAAASQRAAQRSTGGSAGGGSDPEELGQCSEAMAFTAAERRTTLTVAEEDGFTLSITTEPTERPQSRDDLQWAWAGAAQPAGDAAPRPPAPGAGGGDASAG